MKQQQRLKSAFTDFSDKTPRFFQSPGRINLLGDHTDYNLGWTMPAAIDRYVNLAIGANYGTLCRIVALDVDESYVFDLSYLSSNEAVGWPNYFIGVVALMRKAGVDVRGFDCIFTSDIPIGAGLSSSAALCCCLAYALNEIYGGMLPKEHLVEIAQMAEHEFRGVKCGNMDQTASLFGQKDQVLSFDCRSRDISYSTLDLGGYELVVCDSGVKHSHASSGYNDRRYSCDQIIEFFQKRKAGVESLRDISISELHAHKARLGPVFYKRGLFVLAENQRVLDGQEYLRSGDLQQFGKLMYASHRGLSTDYEVSCPELDYLVELTRPMDFVFGSRMMGGGFGGCTVNLVDSTRLDLFHTMISEGYWKRFSRSPKILDLKLADGTSEVEIMDYAI